MFRLNTEIPRRDHRHPQGYGSGSNAVAAFEGETERNHHIIMHSFFNFLETILNLITLRIIYCVSAARFEVFVLKKKKHDGGLELPLNRRIKMARHYGYIQLH